MNARRGLAVAVLAAVAMASACSRSHGGQDSSTVLVAAVVGPDGGTLRVDDGEHAGLQLVVPPGALTTTMEVRVLAVPQPQILLSTLPAASVVFRLEPDALALGNLAVLRMPYRPEQVYDTAPGNVVARTSVDGVDVDRPPVLVDLAAKVMTTTIDRFGAYRVVPGPVAALDDYRPVRDDVVDLGGGVTFVAEAVPTASPFAAVAAERWRVNWPEGEQILYFQGDQLVGREWLLESRRDTLTQPVFVWNQGDRTLPPPPEVRSFLLEQPIGTTPVLGTVVVFGAWYWDQPQFVVDQLYADTIRLRISLGWSGNGIAAGSTELEFVFGAGVGLLALAEDGIERTRQTP